MTRFPAAAVMAHHLAGEVDFLQYRYQRPTWYTLAVDRGNEMISAMYNPPSPPS